MIEFEFLVELNSFLAADMKRSPSSSAYMQATYPTIWFTFWPSLIAFDLRYITELAGEIFEDLKVPRSDLLSSLVFDPKEAEVLGSSAMDTYLKYLQCLQIDHGVLMHQLNRFPSYVQWPNELGDALRALPRG